MKRCSHLALVLLVLGCSGKLFPGEVLDRVVAVVDGHAILASEWDEALRYECFQSHRVISEITAAERQATLQRLVDQRLIEDEMKIEGSHPASAEEVERKVAQMREQISRDRKPASPGQRGADWEEALAQFGFSPAEIEEHVARELNVLRFVDRRFRPTIQIEPAEIERYYQETLMPQLQKAGAADPPLAEVANQIRELLLQKALDEQLNHWLQSLRQQRRIQIR